MHWLGEGANKSESSSNQKHHLKNSTHPRARVNRGSRLNHTLRSHELVHRQGANDIESYQAQSNTMAIIMQLHKIDQLCGSVCTDFPFLASTIGSVPIRAANNINLFELETLIQILACIALSLTLVGIGIAVIIAVSYTHLTLPTNREV